MYIKIRNTLSDADTELREHVQRRLSFALSRLADHVRSVYVQLRDINGPRGGIDKSCVVQVQLAQAQPVVIRDMDRNAMALIDRVADRAGQATLRSLRRQQLRARIV